MGHELNKDGASFKAPLHHQDQVSMSPLQLVWESNERRLIKIEIAPQEEIPQEEMAAPIDDTLAQKIYKAIED